MSQPQISVIIPAYNAENYITQALASVLNQTLSDLEVIVVDDLSTDSTRQIVEKIGRSDARVNYIQSAKNGGPGSARNIGIDHAKGQWITFLDSDDWYEPARLKTLIDTANKYNIDIVADNQRFIADDSGEWEFLLLEEKPDKRKILSIQDYIRGDRVRRASRNLGLIKPFIKHDLVKKNAIRYDDTRGLTIGEDFYFLLECLKYEKRLMFVCEPLYNYRTYNTLSVLKQQSIDTFVEWRNMHARFVRLFEGDKNSAELRLMEQRGRDIDRYIQYQRIADPLKHFRFGELFKEIVKNPKSLLLLLRDIIEDPSSLLLMFRYFKSHVKRKVRSFFADK